MNIKNQDSRDLESDDVIHIRAPLLATASGDARQQSKVAPVSGSCLHWDVLELLFMEVFGGLWYFFIKL